MRTARNVVAYYEIFNECLLTLSSPLIGRVTPASWTSKHPHGAPYFLEFLPLLRHDGGVEGFLPEFSYRDYVPAGGCGGSISPAQTAYLSRLIDAVEKHGQIPVLTATRSVGRLRGIKAKFPGQHILLYRNLFHQWCSFTEQAHLGNSYFLDRAIEVVHLGRHDPVLAELDGLFPVEKASPHDPDNFFQFLFLHLYIYSHAVGAADLVVNVDRLEHDLAHREEVEHAVAGQDVRISLADAKSTAAFSLLPPEPRRAFHEKVLVVGNIIANQAPDQVGAAFVHKAVHELLEEHGRHEFYAGSLRSVLIKDGGLLAERDRLRSERDSLTDDLARSQAIRDAVTVARDELGVERDALAAERDRLLTQRASDVAEWDAAHADRNSLVAERDGLQVAMVAERDAMQRDLDAVAAECDRLRAEHAVALADRDAMRAERDAAAAERDGSRAEHSATEAERDAMRRDLHAVAAECDRLRAEHAAALADRDAMRAERDATTAERDGSRAEHSAMVAERDAMQRDLHAVAAECDRLHTEHAAAFADRDAMRAQRDATAAERDGSRAALSAMAAEQDELRAERDKLAADRDSFGVALSAAMVERDTLRSARDTLAARHDVVATELQHARQACESLQADFEQAVVDADMLRQQLDLVRDWAVQDRAAVLHSLSWRLTKPLRRLGFDRPNRPARPAVLSQPVVAERPRSRCGHKDQ